MVRNVWLKDLLDLISPTIPICLLCQKYPEVEGMPLCENCLSMLALNIHSLEINGHNCLAISVYQGFIKELLQEIKYNGKYHQAEVLGLLLGLALSQNVLLQDVDILTPVPLHENRLRKRGFNQALVFAEQINKVCKKPIYNHVKRIKDTVPQSELFGYQRQKNVAGIFQLYKPMQLNKRHVLIVDDIITTGSTFKSMAKALAVHSRKVSGIFVACGN